MSNVETTKSKPSHKAYIVREYGDGNEYWHEVGALWAHGDGDGYTLNIPEGLALSGKIVIRAGEGEESRCGVVSQLGGRLPFDVMR